MEIFLCYSKKMRFYIVQNSGGDPHTAATGSERDVRFDHTVEIRTAGDKQVMSVCDRPELSTLIGIIRRMISPLTQVVSDSPVIPQSGYN